MTAKVRSTSSSSRAKPPGSFAAEIAGGRETARGGRNGSNGYRGHQAPDDVEVTARVVADDEAGRAAAIDVLRGGGVVALPTDTVYGISVALDTPGGIERLFRIKQRPPDKSIALLLNDAAQAAILGVVTPAARLLAEAYWPGGVTLVLARRPGVVLPDVLTGGAATIGLRVPDHPSPRALAEAVGTASRDIGERVGPARGPRCRRDRRAARRRDRPRARWRSGARRPGIDGRGRLTGVSRGCCASALSQSLGSSRHSTRPACPHAIEDVESV